MTVTPSPRTADSTNSLSPESDRSDRIGSRTRRYEDEDEEGEESERRDADSSRSRSRPRAASKSRSLTQTSLADSVAIEEI